MVINSTRSDVALEFTHSDHDFVLVSLSSQNHSAMKQVDVYTDPQGIARLFHSAAADWRGWSGSKSWESIEGDLQLSLESDKLGHVTVSIVLSDDRGQPDPWRLSAELSLEAGQLEELAKLMERFFTEKPAA